ncbi:MAG: ABC transporter ATP-binding protein [Planctomycetota bacterium]
MVLEIESLRTHFETPTGLVPAVDGVSFTIPAGRTLALVGESGCGKSITGLSILRLVPPPGRIVGGRVRLRGRDLLTLPESAMRTIRGDRVAMVFQEPMTSLNPLLPIATQVGEALTAHRRSSRRNARCRTIALLERMRLPNPARVAAAYPHELSGGMRQRVMIAMALACEPQLLIADEPTTALDVTVQAEILGLLRDLQRTSGLTMLFITHDFGVVARVADHVAVMYGGRIVEQAPARELLAGPRHPYTRGLLSTRPRVTPSTPERRLPTIPGEVPDPRHRPGGCAFHPRCDPGRDDPICRQDVPPRRALGPEHWCTCWKAHGRAESPAQGELPARPRDPRCGPPASDL